MTTVTLAELLSVRDESLAVRRTRAGWHMRALTWLRSVDWKPARVAAVAVFLTLAGFLSRHVLVVAGCVAFVVAASQVSAVAGWTVAGVALLFLEVRRR